MQNKEEEITMLEIVCSEGEKILLEEAGFKNVVSFCLLLSYGDIKYTKNTKKVGDFEIDVFTELQKLKGNQKIRIWYSSLDNEDICTLYFLSAYFYDQNIEILTCDVNSDNHPSLGSYLENEIVVLSKNTTKLTREKQKKYKEIWEVLEEQNGGLRVLENGSLKSVTFHYLDQMILNALKKYKCIRYWTFIGECMKERFANFYGDIYFSARINELIKRGMIEICEIRKEKNLIGEWKKQKYIRIKDF